MAPSESLAEAVPDGTPSARSLIADAEPHG